MVYRCVRTARDSTTAGHYNINNSEPANTTSNANDSTSNANSASYRHNYIIPNIYSLKT